MTPRPSWASNPNPYLSPTPGARAPYGDSGGSGSDSDIPWGDILKVAIPAVIGGTTAALSRDEQQKTPKASKMKKQLIDELLKSVRGKGQYSDLFNVDEASFQKSYVDPAMSRYRNMVAPQIQQNYIASGQQFGTGMEDALSRAGVEMNQMLNEQYGVLQNDAKANKIGAMNTILNTNIPVPAPRQSWGNAFMQGAAGSMATPGFGEGVGNLVQGGIDWMNRPAPTSEAARRAPPVGMVSGEQGNFGSGPLRAREGNIGKYDPNYNRGYRR